MKSMVLIGALVAAPVPSLAQLATLPDGKIVNVATAPAIVHVSPTGSDDGDGSSTRPFASLVRAQEAVRRLNPTQAVTVLLADGTWRISAPLLFNTVDGGQRKRLVTWRAAPGARPVISGGLPITGWRRHGATDLWVADVAPGIDARHIWVNDKLARRAIREIPYAAVTATPAGLTFMDASLGKLAALPGQKRIEIEASGFWTWRTAVVDRITSAGIVMQQPGWRNNLIGYDVIARSLAGKDARLYIANSLAFLDEPGEWFLDPDAGRLYYKPRPGEDMANVSVVLPRAEALVSVGGTPESPVQDLRFEGLTFAHTSWLGPSGPEGFVDQQTGTFIKGEIPDYPVDPLGTCSFGCPAFEAQRSNWWMMPAAVQVAAARRVTFHGNTFAHLGSLALGIGNDAGATVTAARLATAGIVVSRNHFFDLTAGAITAGGIRADAHHPPVEALGNRLLVVSDNRIENFGQTYKDSAGILVTYFSGASIVHNDVSIAPYDGIDVGWGWGMWDRGGNPRYVRYGTYDAPDNTIHDTPTALRDVVVTHNRVHHVKQLFHDGGAIYHISSNPGGMFAWNYIHDVNDAIALSLDEASRHVTVRENVVEGAGVWLNANTVGERPFERITIDNLATGNWHRGGKVQGAWTPFMNNRIENDHPVTGSWPADASAVIAASGIRPETADEGK